MLSFSYAQKDLVTDQFGNILDTRFSKTFYSKNYQIVGSFYTVQDSPLIKYAKILKAGKWGYINLKGEEVIKPRFEIIDDFKDGLARASKEVFSRGDYDFVNASLITGLVNLNDSIITSPKCFNEVPLYDELEAFYLNVAIVRCKGKYGLINKKGIEFVPAIYDAIYVTKSCYVAALNGKWGLLDTTGIPLAGFLYDQIRPYSEFMLGYNKKTFVILNQLTGKPASSLVFDDVNLNDFNNTLGFYSFPLSKIVLAVKQNDNYFLVNRKGVRISAMYKSLYRRSTRYFAVKDSSGEGLINDKGELVIKMNVGVFENERMFYVNTANDIKYLNEKFKEIPTSDYSDVGNFNNGMASVYLPGKKKFGFIDSTGRLCVPAIYDHPESGFAMEDGRSAIVRMNSKKGVINRKGEVIIPFLYDELYGSRNGYLAYLNRKAGFIDLKGSIIVPLLYDNIETRYDSFLNVQVNGKWGVINNLNKLMVPTIYDKIANAFIDGLLAVKNNGRWGFVNAKGQVIIPVKYEEIYSYRHGIVQANEQDRIMYIDLFGNEYLTKFKQE